MSLSLPNLRRLALTAVSSGGCFPLPGRFAESVCPLLARTRKRIRSLSLCCAGLLMILLAPVLAGASERVVLQLAWKHQFQFAGYYAALYKGFYLEQGLDVVVVEGGKGKFAREEVSGRRAQYGVAGTELILHRAEGDPFVVLAPIFQHSPSILLARGDRGILNLQDLIGKRVMLLPGKKDADILAAFLNEGVGLDAIRRLDQTYDLNDLISGRAEAVSAYLTNEPWQLEQAGIPAKILSPQTYGVDFYSDCLFTTEREIEAHPDRVKHFLEASLRGWDYAMAHPEEIIDLLMSEYGVKKERSHLRYEADAIRKIMLPDLVDIGHMNPGRWRHIADTYVRLGMLSEDFRLDGFLYDPQNDLGTRRLKRVAGAAILVCLFASFCAVVLFLFNRKLSSEVRERRQAESAYRKSEERYRLLFENMMNGFALHRIVTDRRGRPTDYIFLEVNAAFETMTGLRRSEIIGKSVTDVLPGIEEDTPGWIERYGKVALSGEEARFEQYAGPLGKWFSVLAFRPRKDHFATIFEDITERRRAEKDRKDLQKQLLQSQKMESIGRLAGGLAHDFNNVLGVILGYTDIILCEMAPGDPNLTNLGEIQKAARRSADLIRQLLAFARKQTISPKVLDLNATIGNMINMLKKVIGEDINLKWQPGTDLWPVKMDPAQIDQILANLCVNARDALQGAGTVEIKTENRSITEEDCRRMVGLKPGSYAVLMVGDDGRGMDKETLERLFEPFFTTKEVGKGTGLGLSTVYGIVKQNDGYIHVVSEPGQGSTFIVHLPKHDGGPVREKTPGPEQALGSRGETILLVEDDPGVLKMGKMMLQRLGYVVLTADRPEDAIQLARHYSGRIDLLLTDVVMPQMSGKDLAGAVAEVRRGTPALFMSGYATESIADHCVLGEDTAFISKPFSQGKLASRIRDVLDDRRAV